MAEITLYSSRVCPFAHRCRLALAEKGLDHQLVEIDLRNKPDWYRQINPAEAVPALQQGAFILTESLVINEFINDLADAPPLLPAAAQTKALARRFIAATEASFVPAFYRLLKAQAQPDQAKAADTMLAALQHIDQALDASPGPWLFGAELSLADLAVYPWFERWAVLEHYRGLSVPAELGALHRWLAALQQRDSVRSNAGEDAFFIAQYLDYASGKK